MSFLKRAIRDAVSQGISKGIGDAVGKAVREVVEPRATEYANKAADRFDQAAGNAAQEARKTTSSLEGAFAHLGGIALHGAFQIGKGTFQTGGGLPGLLCRVARSLVKMLRRLICILRGSGLYCLLDSLTNSVTDPSADALADCVLKCSFQKTHNNPPFVTDSCT